MIIVYRTIVPSSRPYVMVDQTFLWVASLNRTASQSRQSAPHADMARTGTGGTGSNLGYGGCYLRYSLQHTPTAYSPRGTGLLFGDKGKVTNAPETGTGNREPGCGSAVGTRILYLTDRLYGFVIVSHRGK